MQEKLKHHPWWRCVCVALRTPPGGHRSTWEPHLLDTLWGDAWLSFIINPVPPLALLALLAPLEPPAPHREHLPHQSERRDRERALWNPGGGLSHNITTDLFKTQSRYIQRGKWAWCHKRSTLQTGLWGTSPAVQIITVWQRRQWEWVCRNVCQSRLTAHFKKKQKEDLKLLAWKWFSV